MLPLRWDLFCRVIDNHGDLGVSFRLARQLARRGETVRLWIDERAALRWMAGGDTAGVELRSWHDASVGAEPGDVVIEAFGCKLPAGFIAAMAACARPPLWIDLEYLSAEPFVERSHALPSPQFGGPGRGLTKWFYFPGFSPRTGGLMREDDLAQRQQAFDAAGWLRAQAIETLRGERRVSVFCYPHAPIGPLAQWLSAEPMLLLLTPEAPPPPPAAPAALRHRPLPWLSQTDYDHLLWSCELNLVRGEDSVVRAVWAGVPFLWHIYPQADGAHGAKLGSFMRMYLHGADAALAEPLQQAFFAWNGLAPWPTPIGATAWRAHARAVRDRLWAQSDLVSRLLGFVAQRR